MTKAFVFDLDGVIRHWDPAIVANAESAHGLPSGALLATAFEPELLLSVVTGQITDSSWRAEVTSRLNQIYPDADGSGAVTAWSEPVGEIIDGSREVLKKARSQGTLCLLTNATDRLTSDLTALGLIDMFDHIFNSSEIGFAKPDERVYSHVEHVLGHRPDQIVYIDDGIANIDAAAKRGWISLLAGPELPLDELLAPHFT